MDTRSRVWANTQRRRSQTNRVVSSNCSHSGSSLRSQFLLTKTPEVRMVHMCTQSEPIGRTLVCVPHVHRVSLGSTDTHHLERLTVQVIKKGEPRPWKGSQSTSKLLQNGTWVANTNHSGIVGVKWCRRVTLKLSWFYSASLSRDFGTFLYLAESS